MIRQPTVALAPLMVQLGAGWVKAAVSPDPGTVRFDQLKELNQEPLPKAPVQTQFARARRGSSCSSVGCDRSRDSLEWRAPLRTIRRTMAIPVKGERHSGVSSLRRPQPYAAGELCASWRLGLNGLERLLGSGAEG